MKHRKIELVPSFDKLIVKVSKKKEKNFIQLFLRFQRHFFIFKKIAFYTETKHFCMSEKCAEMPYANFDFQTNRKRTHKL
jgi:hypothetical protein